MGSSKPVTHEQFLKIAKEAGATNGFSHNRQRDWPKVSQANWRINQKLMFAVRYSQGNLWFHVTGDLGIGLQDLTEEEVKLIEKVAKNMRLMKVYCNVNH